MELNNAIALVTGANRGIGYRLVEALLAAGAKKVYAGARTLDSLKDTIALDPNRVIGVELDVTRDADVAMLKDRAPDITLAINNAGVLDFGGPLDVPFEAIERNFAVNFYGPLRVARAVAPLIEQNGGGAIVNLSTIVALASMPGLAGYNASKAALWSITQSLRGVLASKGVAVHGVFPGPVDTDMAAAITFPKTSPSEVANAIIDGIRAGDEDIFPDPMSAQTYGAWRQDHKAVEHQFAAV
jgi:NAD(P)-dependent dehydrogenase (short-subunit alcohol dehydrogenase family)